MQETHVPGSGTVGSPTRTWYLSLWEAVSYSVSSFFATDYQRMRPECFLPAYTYVQLLLSSRTIRHRHRHRYAVI